MILSNRFGAAFIKTRNTAGTSIEIALSANCGPEDIITPISEPDEKIRLGLGYPGPQNCRGRILDIRRQHLLEMRRRRILKPLRFYNHMPATEVISLVGKETWEGLLTSSIERNPWDRAVSQYYWSTNLLSNRSKRPDFSDWMALNCHRMSNYSLYTSSQSELLVDRIIQYDDLPRGIARVFLELGLPNPILPYAKAQSRPVSSRDYRKLYSDQDAALIQSVCAREIATFGYSF